MLVKRRPPRPTKKEHPTKRTLIDTVVSMLDTVPVEQVTCDAVLEASGISRGSLYYHFADFGDLVEHALAVRFAAHVDVTIDTLRQTLGAADSAASFRAAFVSIMQIAHHSELVEARFEQVIPFAAAASSERLREMLGSEQERLTDAYTEVLRDAQGRGWVNSSLDARAIAVLVQSCSLGLVVDDVEPNGVEASALEALVVAIIDRVLLSA